MKFEHTLQDSIAETASESAAWDDIAKNLPLESVNPEGADYIRTHPIVIDNAFETGQSKSDVFREEMDRRERANTQPSSRRGSPVKLIGGLIFPNSDRK